MGGDRGLGLAGFRAADSHVGPENPSREDVVASRLRGRARRRGTLRSLTVVLGCALVVAALGAPAAGAAPQAGTAVHGGHGTSISSYPFVVQIQSRFGGPVDAGFCGGSLISTRVVLTAAHCVFEDEDRVSPSDIQIFSGQTYLSRRTSANVYGVSRVVPHPRYNAATSANDIAVLRLSRPVPASRVIKPLGPGGAALAAPGRNSTTLGWGPTVGSRTANTNRLQVNTLPIYSRARCADLPDYNHRLFMCAGNGRDGTCQGDSGGPLAIRVNGRLVVAGIVSYGLLNGTCDAVPAAYTRVSSYRAFLAPFIGGSAFTGAAG
jgi:secreted trypsin-like serine protease